MMKVFYKVCLVVVFFVLISVGNQSFGNTKVLFIGNSITYFNEMPTMFKNIAENNGKAVDVTMYAPGGTGFVNHYTDPNVYALFRGTQWDIIVLQPGSSESAGLSYPVSVTVERGKIMLDSIYKYSPCAKVFLYEIPYGIPSATEYAAFFARQTMYKDSVTKMADAMHLQMVPAGECARAYYEKNQNLLLHGSYNDIHPNANGSFLVASAMYATIFQTVVSNTTYYATVQQDTAKKFFTIADTLVLNNLSKWRVNTFNIKANFSYTTTAGLVNFTNAAVNYATVNWNFGDNTTSTTVNPAHTYTAIGTYTVTQKVFTTAGCMDSISKQVVVTSVLGGGGTGGTGGTGGGANNPPINADKGFIQVYPNPSVDNITINGGGTFTEVAIFDVMGKRVLYIQNTNTLSVSKLSAGVYFVKVNKQGKYYTTSFVKR